jgi:transposase
MSRLTFSDQDQQALHKERFEHPHPRVQQRMEVLWLISHGLVYPEVARLAGVSEATVDRYVALYRHGGLDALRALNWGTGVSALLAHKDSLEASFRRNPPIRWRKPAGASRRKPASNVGPPRCAPF